MDELEQLEPIVMSEEEFQDWILQQTSPEYTIEKEDDHHLKIKTDFGEAEINFYDMAIVEISITSYKDNENKFWLHFQLNDEEHARQLFTEMIEALLSLKNDRKVRILLSCSSAMTTSFFAEKLNEAAKALELDYEFNAVSYLNLYEEAPKYDMILIAPQIGYMYKKLSKALPDKPVLAIPTALFASYDAMKTLEFIRKGLDEFQEARIREKKEEPCSCCLKDDVNILSIAFKIEERDTTLIYYRLYHNGQIVLDDLVKKPNLRFGDVKDVLDIVNAQYKDIDMIGIAAPGIVNEGSVIMNSANDINMCNLRSWIESKFHIPVFISNNTNAAAEGYALAHPETKNIVYHSQPFGMHGGGQGYILDGKLHTGRKGLSGEFKFFQSRMQYSDEPSVLAKTDQGMLELVSKALLPAISILGPDVVAVKSRMTPDMDELKAKLSSFIPEDLLPAFEYIPDDRDYLLDGQMNLTLEALKKTKKEKKEKTV